MASKLSQTLQKAFKSPSGQGLLAACPVTSPYSPVIDRVEDNYIRKIRISFRKDRQLSTNKIMLKEAILSFEKERKYTGHISIDVDPA
jgi:primosomal protein N'